MEKRAYINDDGCFCKVENQERIVTYCENDIFFKEVSPQVVREFLLPVEPKRYKDKIVLFDYYRGVEIIGSKSNHFINVRAVWKALIIKDNLLLFTQKKIFNYSLKDYSLIAEFNRSENLEVSNSNDGVIFYRFKNNKSYIYNPEKNELFLLENMIKDELHIFKAYNDWKKLYLLTNNGILIYDYCQKKCYFEFACSMLVTGHRYSNLWPFKPNYSINVCNDSYSIDNLRAIYLKYGQFYLTMIVDPEKVEYLELKNLLIEQIELLDKSLIIDPEEVEYLKLNNLLIEQNELSDKTFINTYDDLKNLLKKYTNIGIKIKKVLNL